MTACDLIFNSDLTLVYTSGLSWSLVLSFKSLPLEDHNLEPEWLPHPRNVLRVPSVHELRHGTETMEPGGFNTF